MSTNSTVKLYNVSFTESGADFLSSAPVPPTNALTFSTLTPVKLSDKFFKIDITNFNYNDIYTKNYVQITNPDGTYYAYIKGVEWLSYNCVRVDFSLDLWHTYISRCTIKSGFLERSNDKTIPITNRGDISPSSYTGYINGQRVYSSSNILIMYISPFPENETNDYKHYLSPVPTSGAAIYVPDKQNLDDLLKAIKYDTTRIISSLSLPRVLFGYDIPAHCTHEVYEQTQAGYWQLPQGVTPYTNTYTVSLPLTNDEFFGCGSSPCTKVRLRVGGQSQDYDIENLDVTNGKLTYYVSIAFNAPSPTISVKLKTKTIANAGDAQNVLPPITISDFPSVPVTVTALQQWIEQKRTPALFSAVTSLALSPTMVNAVRTDFNIIGQETAAKFEPPTRTAASSDTLFNVNDFGIYIDMFVPTVAERTRIVSLYNYIGFPFNKPVTSLNIFPKDGEDYRQTTLKNAVIAGNIPDEAREFITGKLSSGVRVWRSL